MKRLSSIILTILLLSITIPSLYSGICSSCDCKSVSQTFFAIRPQYQSGSPEKESLFYERMDLKEDGHYGTVQAVLFGGKSNHRDELGSYFAPFCKKCLYVSSVEEDGIDINAQHFNIALAGDAIFKSKISFCPQVTTFGIGLTYKQNLSQLWSDDPDRNFDVWAEITSPITRVETNMCMTEKILTPEERTPLEIEGLNQQFYTSMTDAFKQRAWCYGKIDSCCCDMVKWRLADIEVKVGLQRRLDACGNHFYGGYVGLLIPTGNRPCATYVFKPIVGHRKHFGLTKGGYAKFQMWENEAGDRKIYASWLSHILYLFDGEEKRSLDLKYKPWSRYMEVYNSKEQAQMAADFETEGNFEAAAHLSTPGINVFTQCLKVKPRISGTINTAFIFSGQNWEFEAGYNFFARAAECVSLECKWPCGIALKDSVGEGRTNSVRTISQNNINCAKEIDEYESNIINACDLDLESAAHPGMISNTIYGVAGYTWDGKDYPMLFALGGSYEYGDANFVLCRWTGWLKYSLSF